MRPKRKQPEPAAAAAATGEQLPAAMDDEGLGGGEAAEVPSQQRPQDQSAHVRRRMAETARSRAAHFAHYQNEEEEEEGNVHVGGDNVREDSVQI
jgi:hypothetical protein